jgi:hypothetical protein
MASAASCKSFWLSHIKLLRVVFDGGIVRVVETSSFFFIAITLARLLRQRKQRGFRDSITNIFNASSTGKESIADELGQTREGAQSHIADLVQIE